MVARHGVSVIQVLVYLCKYVTIPLKRHFTVFFLGEGGNNMRATLKCPAQVLAPLQNSLPRIPLEDPLDKRCQATGNH